MEKTIKINMPFERVNASLPENEKLDFEKYKYCVDWGRLSFDLHGIEMGAFKRLKEPEFYNKKGENY